MIGNPRSEPDWLSLPGNKNGSVFIHYRLVFAFEEHNILSKHYKISNFYSVQPQEQAPLLEPKQNRKKQHKNPKPAGYKVLSI